MEKTKLELEQEKKELLIKRPFAQEVVNVHQLLRIACAALMFAGFVIYSIGNMMGALSYIFIPAGLVGIYYTSNKIKDLTSKYEL